MTLYSNDLDTSSSLVLTVVTIWALFLGGKNELKGSRMVESDDVIREDFSFLIRAPEQRGSTRSLSRV